MAGCSGNHAGKIVIGDYVLVHFDEIGEQIVTAKVFKSWLEYSS